MRRWIACVLTGWLIPVAAHADHHGMVMPEHDDAGSTFGAGVALLAASYAMPFYGGDYEGIVPSASWSMGRFAAIASLPAYSLYRNGNRQLGVGDFAASAQAALVLRDRLRAGIAFGMSAPTGSEMLGFGMGHVMLMPAGWAGYRVDRVILGGTFGYSRAIVGGDIVHDHGPWPLVDPMNMSELTWSATADVAIGKGIQGGVRLAGGIPVGALPGHERVIGAARVAWGQDRIDTAVELQAGLVGDPFTIRGVVQTSLRF